jgi:inhibitor of cysteine peptidase
MRVLAALGFAALIVGVVILLVQAFRQRRVWVWGVVAVVGFALIMIAGALLPPTPVGTSTPTPAALTPTPAPTSVGTPIPTPIFGGAKAYTDPSQRIDAAVGEEFVIALDSDPSTGYSWQPTYDTTLLLLEERVFQQAEGSGGLVGARGTESFRFKALHGAITDITLVYKRPWEQLSEGQTKKTFTVMMFTPVPTVR